MRSVNSRDSNYYGSELYDAMIRELKGKVALYLPAYELLGKHRAVQYAAGKFAAEALYLDKCPWERLLIKITCLLFWALSGHRSFRAYWNGFFITLNDRESAIK